MDPSDKNYLETKNPGFSITEGESHRVCWCCPERNANIIVEQLFDDSLSSPVVEQESFLKDHKSVETKDRCSRKLNFNGLHISKIALKEKVSTKSIAWHIINPVSNPTKILARNPRNENNEGYYILFWRGDHDSPAVKQWGGDCSLALVLALALAVVLHNDADGRNWHLVFLIDKNLDRTVRIDHFGI